MSDRCKQRPIRVRTQAASQQRAISFAAECAMDWRANAAAIQLPLRCNPGKTEIRARDDRKPDTTTARIDCTEPPRDSLHGSYSTSFRIFLTDCSYGRYSLAFRRQSIPCFDRRSASAPEAVAAFDPGCR